jgi:hypothetical protein
VAHGAYVAQGWAHVAVCWAGGEHIGRTWRIEAVLGCGWHGGGGTRWERWVKAGGGRAGGGHETARAHAQGPHSEHQECSLCGSRVFGAHETARR